MVTAQICSASRIATWEHIFFSVLYAKHAFTQKRNISKQLAMEVLLYISGQRQIRIALNEIGIESGDNAIIILGNSEESMKQALAECEKLLGGVKADEILALYDDSKFSAIQGYFQITDGELNAISLSNTQDSKNTALVKVVLNRVALVALEK